MSVTTENAPVQGQTTLQENRAGEGVYASLFEKINLAPASRLGDINDFLDDAALSEAPAAERLTAAMQVFMERIRQSGQRVEKLDKTLIDHHIAELDFQISRQLDAVMHHQEFQQVESLWRGLKQLVDNTDYRQNVKTEILDVAKDDLRQDFEDASELIQSGLYWHTYTAEYDTPGGEPIGSVISAYEFDASPQDVALLRNISRVSAAAHMPFIGAVGPAFFLKETMEEVAAIKDIGNYFDRRLTAAMQVFMERIRQSGQRVEKLDKTLIDHHIAELDFQISRQLDAVMHHQEFQQVESLWRGLKQLVDNTDYRQNVKTEILDVAKDDLRQDFEDAPELIQSGLYWHTYTAEYDTPGGEPIGSVISAYEFDASPQDVALLRNISRVSAAAHMPFIGAVGPAFFLKETMEEVAAIKDIGNYFDRAEYIRWKAFRETDDARYIGLVMPRVLGRLPYGPDTVPVRSFNYVEQVKGPDHEKYLWTSAAFSFASNMVKSFVNNGWCVQIRGPQAGGAVKDLPIHLYDLGTGNQVKIPSEVMIPETREFEFASLGFIPLSYYKNRDYACFFSANSAQKPALYDTADATANSRINARLPYIFLLSRIAHYLKMIQRENIGTTKDRRLLELELNTWVRSLVTEMTDPGDELQASHPLRDASVVVEDIEDNPGFFRVKLYAVPHFQVEGMDVNLSLVSQMPKAKA
ncbi:type VI secretion protein EvpB [Klebsiella pneumoniae]|nr:type VI secretion protein EvpB [Klebsiella pneumoniae]